MRQPLSTLYVKGTSFDEAFSALAEDELNVKKVVFTDDARAFTTYNLKPQMRTLGPKYGKLLGRIGQHLKELDGNEVVDAFSRGETVTFTLDGTEVVLAKDDVLTEATQKPGFSAQMEGEVTVVLDCNLTPELIAEGYQREMVSKLQNMRKDAGFEVSDRIEVTYEAEDELAAAIEAGTRFHHAKRAGNHLCRGAAPEGAVSQEWDLNGKKAVLSVRKA